MADTQGKWLLRENPARPDELAGRIRRDSPAEVHAAASAAAQAQREWAALDFEARAALLRKALGSVEGVDALARTMATEMGKPVGECAGEIRFALAFAADMEERARRLLADDVRGEGPGRRVVRRAPYGVIAAIVPWNAPIILAMTKIAPALLSGNAVLVKPSPFAPLTLSAIVSMIAAHLPAGVLRAVNGGAETGEALIAAPEVTKVAFTGGSTVGRAVLEQTSRRFIPSVMELGGNDPLIVLEDFELTTARMEALVWASFLNAGQVCMAAKRLYVHEALAPRFIDAYVETARRLLYMGDPLDPRTNIGPVISAQAQGRISRIAAQARCDGGVVVPLLGHICDHPEQGYFVPPQLVTGLTDDAELVRDEQFGPIMPIVTWKDEAQVRRWASNGACLSASVWSCDTQRAWDIAASLPAGLCLVNAHNRSGFSFDLPFGGSEASGFGREYGDEGLLEYSMPKALHQPSADAVASAYPGKS
ncbi:hypothetical protein A8V01_06340 [Novosphingobium guangzhouense]|uniref:Aldehyde dehydrogenase domain-containing protein n=2 Tax=Novosphingobium guangzhouense TaxID=1850347 RepID=A0A2K2FXG1_9SPHN|nr:hypothetical protein A8V01_06340 [Novosphingobium guangzhouense]